MAKRPTRPIPTNLGTRGQVQAQGEFAQQRNEVLSSAQQKYQELDRTLSPQGTNLAGGYSSPKEALASQPGAISDTSDFHERLHDHINELRRRVGTIANIAPGSEMAKKYGIDERTSSQAAKLLPVLHLHLDAAENENTRSFRAHQDGTANPQPELAFHTADVAYQNAHAHATDAVRHILTAGSKTLVDAVANNKNNLFNASKLLTPVEQNLKMSEYRNHLKSAAANKKVSLTSGVLESPVSGVNPEAGYSKVGTSLLTKAGIPTSDEAQQEQLDTIKKAKAKNVISRTVANLARSKYAGTLTLGQMETARAAANEGKIRATSQALRDNNPFAGVGFTGYQKVTDAAKVHYEFNNKGQKWEDSPHSKSTEATVNYALQHQIGVPTNAHTELESLLSYTDKALVPHVSAIMAERFEDKRGLPKVPKVEAVNPVPEDTSAPAPDWSTVPKTTKPVKSSRNVEFQTGGNK